jgi:hypothetical protein
MDKSSIGIDSQDSRSRRCPLLGHDVSFSYCRQPGQSTPCRKILDCWWQTFDIQEFLQTHFDESTISQVLAPPKPKMQSLLEMIAEAEQRSQKPE